MPLFIQSKNNLKRVKELKFDLEKDLQTIVEENLEELFGLQFISSEFPLNNLRIDTLAYDPENKSFVIIEYKRGQNYSVIDQGYAYLALLLNNQADFVLEYNEQNDKNFRKDDLDWTQTKVIFISNSFTKYQQEAIGFQDLPIELWEVKKYENNTVSLNQISASEKSVSIDKVVKKNDYEKVTKKVKQYTVEDHLEGKSQEIKELYENLSSRILELDSRLVIDSKKSYVGFKIDWRVVVHIVIYKSGLLVEFRRTKPEDLKDPESRLNYVEKSMKYWNQHVSRVDVYNEEDIDYVIGLVRQVLKNQYSD